MKQVLNISMHDDVGRRFNNLDARNEIINFGWDSKFACWTKSLENEDYVQQAGYSITKSITPYLAKLGRLTGNINGYYRNASAFKNLTHYKNADILHFHVVHEEYLSINDWIHLAAKKPVVWTWHDPYMFNGHCIYSQNCNKFEMGCVTCPNLNYHFPIKRDRSKKNLSEKLNAVKKINPLVILASDYMYDIYTRSVYKDQIRVKVVPFGVTQNKSLNIYKIRDMLGIPKDNIVFGYRAVYSDYKGMQLVLSALKNLSINYPDLPITIIAIQEKNTCNHLSNQYQIIDTGWVGGDEIFNYYSSMDYFLMPSKSEAFGMMAIEAMSAGAMPIVTLGTALPSLVGAPVYGLCSEHDEKSYSEIILKAALYVKLNRNKREKLRLYAREQYSMNNFAKKISENYYEEVEYFNRIGRST